MTFNLRRSTVSRTSKAPQPYKPTWNSNEMGLKNNSGGEEPERSSPIVGESKSSVSNGFQLPPAAAGTAPRSGSRPQGAIVLSVRPLIGHRIAMCDLAVIPIEQGTRDADPHRRKPSVALTPAWWRYQDTPDELYSEPIWLNAV